MDLVDLVALSAMALSTHSPAPAVQKPEKVGRSAIQSEEPYIWSGACFFKFGRNRYSGSGTIIGRDSVLTCAHLIYDPVDGEATNMRFHLAHARTATTATERSKHRARAQYTLSRYRFYSDVFYFKTGIAGSSSRRAFARDLGGIRIDGIPNVPTFGRWTRDFLLLNKNLPRMSVGYGLDPLGSGNLTMLKVSPSGASYGQEYDAFFHNFTYALAWGMSGGPTWVYLRDRWYIAGINVAGWVDSSGEIIGSGIRVLNDEAARFISLRLGP